MKAITIFRNGIKSGNGRLTDMDCIIDCTADLSTSKTESKHVYSDIEDCIGIGLAKMECDGDVFTWEIE